MKLLQSILGSIAARIIKKYKPLIVGITGSAGKTSTKEAVLSVLTGNVTVRATPKSYNTEVGLPCAVIGEVAAGKDIIGWMRVIIRGVWLLITRSEFPKVLVLEMGADHPGDLKKLTDVATPVVSIVTAVGTAHIGFFGSLGAIAEEKETLVRVLPPDGTAILNVDDPRVDAMRSATKAKVVTYGLNATADVRATAVEYLRDPKTLAVLGLQVNVTAGAFTATFDLPGVLGKGHVRAALAALACARAVGVPLAAAATGLARYAPPPSRVRLIPGVRGTVIIDDSYNASPAAMFEALEVLKEYPVPTGRKRIALLGDMRELGNFTEKAHREVGERVARDQFDLFVAVGEAMHDALEAAKGAGMNEDKCIHMADALSAGKFLQDRIRAGDVILIKGSQNTIRLERAVKELMAEPERAKELICRQGKEWQ